MSENREAFELALTHANTARNEERDKFLLALVEQQRQFQIAIEKVTKVSVQKR